MKIYYKPKVMLIGAILICLMLRASYWQYQRYLKKLIYISKLEDNLQYPVTELSTVIDSIKKTPEEFLHRRVKLSGTFDFAHEMILRNRRLEEQPGVFVITPLKLSGSEQHTLVSRGFIPLNQSGPTERKRFEAGAPSQFIALIKSSSEHRIFAPTDPESGAPHPWVDAWLRVDINNMSKQLPYPILPVYLELMGENEETIAQMKEKIINAKSDKAEMLFMPGRAIHADEASMPQSNLTYPVPIYDTIIPPGRHFGYIFEWAIMAVMTFLICLAIQLKPTRS